jgi:tetratricopeptide (TPR) repeat protein
VTEDRRGLDPDVLAALEEQHAFLVRSLDDLEREHDAGDLDERDYVTLKADYAARAATTRRSIDEGHTRLAASRRPPNRLRMLAWVAVAVLVAGLAGYLVTQTAGRRDAGESATGDVRTTIRADLDAALLAGEEGDLVEAFQRYAKVLDAQPSNVEALAYRGWFIGRTGELDRAEELIGRALAIDDGYGDAKVFLAYVTSSRGDDAKALELLDEAAADGTNAYATAWASRLRKELTP